ncbi:MAG: aldo/keto reductase [Chitinispirillaceae bacterium]|nr:aldo/keto reductase [Chitinispirillaceae bacterium]
MKKRVLGKSGIKVGYIGMGLWGIGGDAWGPTDDKESIEAIEAAIEEGCDFFDTADVYGMGHSEELLGKALKGKREKVVIATKIGWIGFDKKKGISAYNSVEKVIKGVEESLRRLNTEYVDIIQDHIDFYEPNMEIIIEAFQKLQQQGKVKAYGVSTGDLNYLKKFNSDGKCSTLQIDYSILNRIPEKDILPYCKENNIGVIVRGALAMGILTGKFTQKTIFPDGDFRQNWIKDIKQREIFLDDLQKVERLKKEIGESKPLSVLALQFVLSNDAVSVVIPGAKNKKQIEMNVSASKMSPLSEKEISIIDSIVPPCGGRKIWPA